VTTVVHLITTLTQGGAERVLSESVPLPGEHPGERHVVVSLVPGGMFADVLRARGVEVRDLGMRPGRDLVRGTVRLVQVLREVRADTVLAWLYHAALVAELARVVARRSSVTWIFRGALDTYDAMPRHTRATIALLARRSSRKALIAVNSRAGIADHQRVGFRPNAWALTVNGCDTTVFAPNAHDRAAVRAELGVRGQHTVTITVGRDHHDKGLDVLLDALELLPPDEAALLHVLLVGTGTDQVGTRLRSSATLHRLGERDDVARLLRGADLLVLPSRTEGTPNVVLEAMATGLPCIVTDVGDCRELVADTGAVVATEDPAALASALLAMMRRSPTERSELGAQARERIVTHFDRAAARATYRRLWTGGEG
jgi:glycosyltransferase involved in cell wall biosynthesis